MWALSVPFMIFGIAVAIGPILWAMQHYRKDRIEARSTLVAEAVAAPASRASGAFARLSVLCPVCAVQVTERSEEFLIDAVQRHAWRSHGIPSRHHILETTTVA